MTNTNPREVAEIANLIETTELNGGTSDSKMVKTGLLDLAKGLVKHSVRLLGSGGTAKLVSEAGFPIEDISAVTKAPEMLGGRVKTLHPSVHGGILAREDVESDEKELEEYGIDKVDYVICNLYPFKKTVSKPNVSIEAAVEEIDIGGVTLLRAAAKNHARVVVLSDPTDYPTFMEALEKGPISSCLRNEFALKAFLQTADYDLAIADFFRRKYAPSTMQLSLRYGINPHQLPAQAYVKEGRLPFKVLSGSPGYVNLLDALNAWPLVKELSAALDLPAAASFKHVSPAGAAVGLPLSETERKVFFVDDIADITPLASAYARARGADRMSSFGDWIAVSSVVDVCTAKIISREVSDGIIAPGYESEALEILKKKKDGRYTILKVDEHYTPPHSEIRQVFGVTLQQNRNDAKINPSLFCNIVSNNRKLPDSAMIDLIVATISLKYTQSNSVCYAKNGMTIGIGAGQQSRIHCTRSAGDKANQWWLRHHPRILNARFANGVKRPEKSNAIDLFVSGNVPTSPEELKQYNSVFDVVPAPLTSEERSEYLDLLTDVVCSSDAFLPFPDNVHRMAKSGVKYVAAPKGSIQDEAVFAAASEF